MPGNGRGALREIRLCLEAGKERDLRELYRQRAPYELLQNADDAGASTVIFALATDGLAFAHNGRWFNVGNFRSLADGWSDKDPMLAKLREALKSALKTYRWDITFSMVAVTFQSLCFAWLSRTP